MAADTNNGKIQLNLLEPRATEKTYGEQTKRIYMFPVAKSMSKQAIKELIEGEFGVTVTDVKTLIRKGKKTRFSRGRHAYPGTTYRRDKKYAYVRLKEGDSIRVFDEDNAETSAKEAPAPDKKAERAEKKAAAAKQTEADKNAGKENK